MEERENSTTLQSRLVSVSVQPDDNELIPEIWYWFIPEVNLSVAEPVESTAPAILMSTGDSNPSESETSETSPLLTLPLVGMMANAEEGVDPISIVIDLDPFE